MNADIAAALAAHDLRAVGWECISTFSPGLTPRQAYRIRLADGRTIKARRTLSPDHARRVETILAEVDDDRFARVLGRHGAVLLEEWLAGVPLTDADQAQHLRTAAALLAKLHGIEALEGATVRLEEATRERRAIAEGQLTTLVEAGAISAAAAARLRAALDRTDPGRTTTGLVHLDYCFENMILDPEGRLRVIDNEAMAVGALAYDLARCWNRSAMPDAAWRVFEEEYRRRGGGRGVVDDPLFWRIVATVVSAATRVERRQTHAEVPAGRLRRLAADLPAARKGPRPSSRSVALFCMFQRGHFQRIRALVAALAARGVAAHVFTDRRFEREVAACGGRFEDLFADEALSDADGASTPAPFRYVSFAGFSADPLVERVAALKAGVVVYDSFAVVGRIVGHRLGVPYVNVCAGHAVSPGRMPELLPGVGITHPSARCTEAARRLSGELEMAPGDPFSYLCAPSRFLNICCEPPEFLSDAERGIFEPVAFFGSIDPAGRAGDLSGSTFPPRSPGRLNVYVSFGTVTWRYCRDEVVRTLRSVADDLARMPTVQAVVSLGGHEPAESTLTASLTRTNVRVVNYIDQWAFLRQADVFITHQGLNSTHEAVYHRVPMAAYPFLWDQPGLARRCEELGLSRLLIDDTRAALPAGRVAAVLSTIDRDRTTFDRHLEIARQWEERVIAERPRVVDRILALA